MAAPRRPHALLVISGGFLLGMLSWFLALATSGTFEPYDSAFGLLANQLVLSGAAAVLGFRYGPQALLYCLMGAYLGMNAYAYAFGGSEHRAWALLGAVSSMFLVLVPGLIGAVAASVRRFGIGSPPNQ